MSSLKTKKYYVYLARCKDNSLYTGKTNDLNQRITIHNNGKGAKFIKRHGNAKIVYSEEYNNHLEASRRERQIKKWSRIKKENLIKYGHPTKFKKSKY